ncbi:MAG TPA: response regulator [Thermoanaerobaculia bacterium]|nr:response regulator [Thermoanaerobaculia bacterium]
MQSRGILTALRAAAIVIIATGLNQVLAGALPRYEPLYLYLAAIALVVILDGLLLGALTAIGAISFYALLFMPRPAAFSKAVLVPFGAALATVIMASIVRGALRVRTRRVAVAERLGPPTPLLMAPIVIDHGEVLSAIDELRGELRSALSEVSQEDARVAELERALASERAAHETDATRIAKLERALADERHAREAGVARLTELDGALEAARAENSLRAEELGAIRSAADELLESTRERAADQERLLRLRIEELEESLVGELQWRDAALVAERERVAALESELATERAASDQKLNTIMVHLAQDHEADLGKAVEEREEARAEARSLAMRAAGLQKKLEEQRLALDDATRLLAETRIAAQQEIDRLHARVGELEKPAVVRPRILIAHPDADLRRNAGASLERAGYEIVSAADGLEALRTAIAQRPAVVIADAIMPKMDGRELCQLLKSQEKTAHIRVILLTRSTDTPPKGDLMPDEVLRKPVPLETLKTTLAALLA